MLIVTLSCLPKLEEAKLKDLFDKFVKAAVDYGHVGIESERDILVRFLPDSMTYGLGTDMLLEVGFFHANGRHIYDGEKGVCSVLREVLQEAFPEAKVYTRFQASDSTVDFWPEEAA